MDRGREFADAELKRLEKEFAAVYAQAEREVQEKLEEHLRKFEKKDVLMRKKVERGELSKSAYKRWCTSQILTGKEWEKLRDDIAYRYTVAYKDAADAINTGVMGVYAESINFSTFAIESCAAIETRYMLYDLDTVKNLIAKQPNLLPLKEVDGRKVERWNRRKVASAVTQGILQGEGTKGISKRLRVVTGMNRKSSVLNARTSITSAESSGRMIAYKRAESMGLSIEKQWLAIHDHRTRHTHRVYDRMVLPLDGEFAPDLKYPGDDSADPSEVYNCRCRLVGVIDGRAVELSADTVDGMSYDEWKAAKPRRAA